jgi:hypothetical protein
MNVESTGPGPDQRMRRDASKMIGEVMANAHAI